MEPLILRRAVLADHAVWRDTLTDTDPLPAVVITVPGGETIAKQTGCTEVTGETTDDQKGRLSEARHGADEYDSLHCTRLTSRTFQESVRFFALWHSPSAHS
jgi:hypothetical protein